jgi:hypothetical protein
MNTRYLLIAVFRLFGYQDSKFESIRYLYIITCTREAHQALALITTIVDYGYRPLFQSETGAVL